MRRAARTDETHAEIVQALRDMGCAVLDLSRVGLGCPDVLIRDRGQLHLGEIKDGKKSKSRRKLTPAQVKFHAEWGDSIVMLESVEDAVRFVQRGEPCQCVLCR